MLEDNWGQCTVSNNLTEIHTAHDYQLETYDTSPVWKRRWFRGAKKSYQPQDWLRYKAFKKQAQKKHMTSTKIACLRTTTIIKSAFGTLSNPTRRTVLVLPLWRETDSLNMANIMDYQFCSVFTQEDLSDLPDLGPSQTPNVPLITDNVRGVLKLLKGINPPQSNCTW